jgi:hypothetical protein
VRQIAKRDWKRIIAGKTQVRDGGVGGDVEGLREVSAESEVSESGRNVFETAVEFCSLACEFFSATAKVPN